MSMPNLQENISLAKYTTFKVGGSARYFCEPSSQQGLLEILEYARKESLPFIVLGRGSNVVISDHGYPGLVIHIGDRFSNIKIEKNRIYAESGALLNSVVLQAIKAGLGGMQKLGGIPGSVGGGVYINAGAYGQEIAQVIKRVE